MNELSESLKLAGLSANEAKTYLDLFQFGESKTGKICERTNLPSSIIYKILDSLLKKGLLTYKLVNGIKVFQATNPDNIAYLFEEKEKQVRNEKDKLLLAISDLKKLPVETDRLSDFQYYQGVRGIKSLFTKIINSWKAGDEYYIASAPMDAFNKLEGFFMDVVFKKKNEDHVKLKILVNKSSKRYGEKRKKEPLTQVKYLDIKTSTEYGVLNKYFFMINYGKEPYGLLIEDKNFAKTYKIFFDILWNVAEK